VRLYVAGAARVAVVTPGAAHVPGALEEEEVLLAALPEPYPRAQPREAAADDGDARVYLLDAVLRICSLFVSVHSVMCLQSARGL